MSEARPPGHAMSVRRNVPGHDLPAGFGVLWTTVAIDLLGFGIVVPLLPLYARHLGAGPVSIGFLLAAYSAAQLACAPLLGRLSDRVGRRPVLLVSLVGTAAASLLTGVAGSLWLLLVAAACWTGPRAGAWRWRRLRPATWWSRPSGPECSACSAPPSASGSWSAPPWAGWPPWAAPACRSSWPGPSPRATRWWRGAGCPRRALGRRRRAPPGGAGPAPGGAAPGGVLRTIAVPAVVTLLAVGAFSAFEATFPLFGHHRLGFGLGATGVVFALVGTVVVVVQLGAVRPAVTHLGEAGCLRLGLALEGLGLLVLPTAHSRPGLVVPLVLVAAGQSLITPALAVLVAARVGRDRGRRRPRGPTERVGPGPYGRPGGRGTGLRAGGDGLALRGGRPGGGGRPAVLPGHAQRPGPRPSRGRESAADGCRRGPPQVTVG